ncbi:serine acetyltransferase [Mycobacterium sp. CPCC 205372]|uniref:Serine acetyltransferase n=1 Tax=Mycobacterium hippophais TaxID=3016340 RepID=A0ABT4PRZ7_9MYCO|nr:serine acetyltransferase [Mycobacterium hippophais]MCZ8379269.1 serine acetyltransferase [Mycobacterium hippophais]
MATSRRDTLLNACAAVWAWPLWLGVRLGGATWVVERDVEQWAECIKLDVILRLSPYRRFARCAGSLPEFRSLIHHRIHSAPALVRFVLRHVYRGERTLRLRTQDVGAGLFIQHGIGTMIDAASIGVNCWINQAVTIGPAADGGRPVIGNNVRIAAGARIIGAVTIGDKATIGLNGVVMSDVPAGTVMVTPLAQPLDKVRR